MSPDWKVMQFQMPWLLANLLRVRLSVCRISNKWQGVLFFGIPIDEVVMDEACVIRQFGKNRNIRNRLSSTSKPWPTSHKFCPIPCLTKSNPRQESATGWVVRKRDLRNASQDGSGQSHYGP